MISCLEVQDIRKNVCFGKATKEEGETCETSMLIRFRAGVEDVKNKSNFCNRANRNAIDGEEESGRQIIVIEVLISIGPRE